MKTWTAPTWSPQFSIPSDHLPYQKIFQNVFTQLLGNQKKYQRDWSFPLRELFQKLKGPVLSKY